MAIVVAGLVDTNILIDLLRGYAPASNWIATQTNLGVSRIVWLEFIQGAPNRIRQRQALNLLNQFSLVKLSDADFDWAARQLLQFHLSHNVGMMDCLIAASAHRLQLPLFTRNLKHLTPLLGTLAQQPYS